MGIGDWLRERRERRDAIARDEAANDAFETEEERLASDPESAGRNADERALRRMNMGSNDDVNRMGDGY